MSSRAEFELVMFGPNIIGSATYQIDVGCVDVGASIMSGAFARGSQYPHRLRGQDGGGSVALTLNASLSSQVYGASSTVQPLSIRVLPLIKF